MSITLGQLHLPSAARSWPLPLERPTNWRQVARGGPEARLRKPGRKHLSRRHFIGAPLGRRGADLVAVAMRRRPADDAGVWPTHRAQVARRRNKGSSSSGRATVGSS